MADARDPSIAQPADPCRYTLDLSPDKMELSLCVVPPSQGSRTTVTDEEVLAAVTAQGVRHGIDNGAVGEAVRSADGSRRVVARGRPPERGVNGHLRWQVAAVTAAFSPDEPADGGDGSTALTVEAGATLAVVVRPTPGRPGVNVLGEVVPVDLPLVCTVVAGAGSELQGETLLSTRVGRPMQSAVGSVVTVKVLPFYQHLGYVDMSSGHLNVAGDLLITGSVTAGMAVHAEGSVTIRGHVLQGEVRAGGSITVQGNAIGSTLVAGARQAFYRAILPGLVALDNRLGELALLVGQLLRQMTLQVEHIQRTAIGPVLNRLMETSFADLPISAQTLVDQVTASADRTDELAQLLAIMLHSKLLGQRLLAVPDLTELTRVRHLLARIQKTMELETAHSCAIAVPYCEQSTLRSSGIIRVGERGCFHSELTAYQHMAVQGAVLGGSLTCQGSIEASTLGNEAGEPTDATVGALGWIRAAAAHPGVTVRVGRLTSKVRARGPLDVRAESIGRTG